MIIYMGLNVAQNNFYPGTGFGRIFRKLSTADRFLADLDLYDIVSYRLDIFNPDTDNRDGEAILYRVKDNRLNLFINRKSVSYSDSGELCHNRSIAESLKTTYRLHFPEVEHEDLQTIAFKLRRIEF